MPPFHCFFCKLWATSDSLDKAMCLFFHFSPLFISITFLNRCYKNAQLWVPGKGSLSGFDTWVLRHLSFLRGTFQSYTAGPHNAVCRHSQLGMVCLWRVESSFKNGKNNPVWTKKKKTSPCDLSLSLLGTNGCMQRLNL